MEQQCVKCKEVFPESEMTWSGVCGGSGYQITHDEWKCKRCAFHWDMGFWPGEEELFKCCISEFHGEYVGMRVTKRRVELGRKASWRADD